MFIIKYHKKGLPTKYFGQTKKGNGLVTRKENAYAFGEGARDEAEKVVEKNLIMSLVSFPASEIAEEMYRDSVIRIKDIRW